MKKLVIYYLFVLLPVFGLIMVRNNSLVFCIGLFLYALVYRPLVDYVRLKSLNINEKYSSFFIPFYIHTKYFKKLYANI
jgi:hypothetical protein